MLGVKELLLKLILTSAYRVQRGYKTAGSSIAAGGYLDVQVTFGHAYASAPIVVASLRADSASTTGENAKVEAYVIAQSTTDATIRLFNSASIARTPSFNWIAVGPV